MKSLLFLFCIFSAQTALSDCVDFTGRYELGEQYYPWTVSQEECSSVVIRSIGSEELIKLDFDWYVEDPFLKSKKRCTWMRSGGVDSKQDGIYCDRVVPGKNGFEEKIIIKMERGNIVESRVSYVQDGGKEDHFFPYSRIFWRILD